MGERETTDPRQDCPWKCKTGSPDCLCDQTGFARSACISTGPQCAPAPAEAVAWMSTDGRIVVPAHEMAGWVNQYAKDGVPIPLFAHPAPARGEAVRRFCVVCGATQVDNERFHALDGGAFSTIEAITTSYQQMRNQLATLARPDRERGE